jgi:TP901 family phage tail tape measure protein
LSTVDVGTLRGHLELDDKLSSRMDVAVRRVGEMGQSLTKLGKQSEAIGRELTAKLTLPIIGIGVVALKTGTDFIKTMNLVGAVTDASEKDFGRLEAAAVEWGQKTQFSATEAADAMLSLGKAGFNTDQTIGALPSTLQLAAAANMSLADAADLTSNVMKTFGLEIGSLAHSNDILAAAANASTIDVTDLRESIKFVGPIAKAAGLSLADVSAAAALMGEAGIKGSMGGTALRAALSELMNPGKKTRDILTELGFGADVSAGRMVKLTDVLNKLHGRTDSAAKSMEMFGDRGGPAMHLLAERGGDAMLELSAKLNLAEGSAKRMADAAMKGLPGAIEEMKGSLETASTMLLKTLEPAFTKGAKFVGDLAEVFTTKLLPAFGALPDGAQLGILAMVGFAAAIGPTLWVMGSFVTVAGQMATAMKSLMGLQVVSSLLHLESTLLKLGMSTGFAGNMAAILLRTYYKIQIPVAAFLSNILHLETTLLRLGMNTGFVGNAAAKLLIAYYKIQIPILNLVSSTTALLNSGKLLATVFGVLRTGLGLLTGPIGWLITGLTLVGAWLTKTEDGANFLSNAWGQLKTFTEPLRSILGSLGSILKDSVSIGIKMATDLVGAAIPFFKGLYASVSSLTIDGFAKMVPGGELVVGMFRGMRDMALWVWDGLKLTSAVVGELGLKFIQFVPGGEQALAVFRMIRDVLGDVAKYAKEAAGWVHGYAQSIGAVKTELPKVASPQKAVTDGLVANIAATTENIDLTKLLSQEFTNSITPKQKAAAGTTELTEEQEKHNKAIQELVDTLSGADLNKKMADLAEAYKKASAAGKLNSQAVFELGVELQDAAAKGATLDPVLESLRRQSEINAKGWDYIAVRVKAYFHTLETGKKSIEDYVGAEVKALGEITNAREKGRQEAVKLASQLEEADKKATMSKADFAIYQAERTRDESLRAIEPLKTYIPGVYESARAGVLREYQRMVDDAKSAVGKQKGVWAQLMQDLPSTITSAIQGGGDIGKSITNLLGNVLGGDNGPVSKILYSGLNKIGTRIPAGLFQGLANAIPAAGPLIGAAIGKLGGMVMDKFFGTAGRDVVKDFASKFEGGFSGLRAELLPLGADGERLWKNLTQGVGKNNPEQAKKAIEAITAALKAHGEEQEKLNGVLAKYGVEWEKMPAEVKAKEISASLKELIEDHARLIKVGMDSAGATRAQAQAYNDLIAKTKIPLGEMPLDLAKTTLELAKMGLLTEENTRLLLGMTESTLPNWREMQSIAEEFGIDLANLGPQFEAAKLGELFTHYADSFSKLQKGGTEMSVIIAGMGDEVNEAVAKALKMGIEVPASMKPMLEAMLKAGELTDENGEKMTDLTRLKFGETMAESTDRLIAKLDELIAKLTGEIPNAIQTMVGKMHDGLGGLKFDAKVNFGMSSGSGQKDPIQMASGGAFRVNRSQLFEVGEGGPEEAIFSGANRTLADTIGFNPEASHGRGSENELTQNIVVMLGEKPILRAVRRGTPRDLRIRGGS